MKRVFLIFGLIFLGLAVWWGVPFFTMGPSQAEMDSYRTSPQFDRAAKRFRNPVAEPEPEAGKKMERSSYVAKLVVAATTRGEVNVASSAQRGPT